MTSAKARVIAASIITSMVAALFSVSIVAAWHVDTECELIKYDGYTYKVYTTDYELVQDWTTGDTPVDPGTYKVKFTNGEKTTVEIDECERPTPPPAPTPPPPAPTPPSTTPTTPPSAPRVVRVSVAARGMLCGDPRAWTRFQNKGTTPVKVRVVFVPGNKDKPAARRVVSRVVPAGKARIIGPRWVRGRYLAQVNVNGHWRSIFGYRVGKTLTPNDWDEGGCPSDRFGKPKWTRPMVSNGLARLFTIAD